MMVKQGRLVLCDLAGSERPKTADYKIGSESEKDAIEINKSLTCLGDVIAAVSKKAKHIPFKNHRLTELLADALGGNTKALMFVNCSPASSNFQETLCSLQFASRVKNISSAVTQRFLRVNSAAAGGEHFKHIERLREQFSQRYKETECTMDEAEVEVYPEEEDEVHPEEEFTILEIYPEEGDQKENCEEDGQIEVNPKRKRIIKKMPSRRGHSTLRTRTDNEVELPAVRQTSTLLTDDYH